MATGSDCVTIQTTPHWRPAPRPSASETATTISLCEPRRKFIESQLHLERTSTAFYQDLFAQQSFDGQYNSIKLFVVTLRSYRARFRYVVWKSSQQI